MSDLHGFHEVVHLGDGAYVGHDGSNVVVFASNGIHCTNQVVLEPEAIDKLREYSSKLEARRGTDPRHT